MYTPRFLCFISILAPLNGLWTFFYSTSHVISTSRCSVLWYSSFVWLKASAKWRNANVNVPLLRVNPQCTPMGTAVNGWVMKHYWLPPSTMKAHQREEAKDHQHPRQTSIYAHTTPIPVLAENCLLSVTLCITSILLQVLKTLTPGHKTAEAFQSIQLFTNVHSKNHSVVI